MWDLTSTREGNDMDLIRKRIPVRTLIPKGVDCEISHRLERETKYSFIRVWKPLLSSRVLKTGILKEKSQRWQYLLAVGLSCYKWYQSQTLGGVPVRMIGLERDGLWDLTPIGQGNDIDWWEERVPTRTLGVTIAVSRQRIWRVCGTHSQHWVGQAYFELRCLRSGNVNTNLESRFQEKILESGGEVLERESWKQEREIEIGVNMGT